MFLILVPSLAVEWQQSNSNFSSRRSVVHLRETFSVVVSLMNDHTCQHDDGFVITVMMHAILLEYLMPA